MKFITLFALLISSTIIWSQKSENLVPKDAMTVISIDNISLLQKISMDDLISYEFMEEIHSEIFDGSTNGKTLKDSGIDFDQRFNIFSGQVVDYVIAGFTFGITDKSKLFEVFDDFELIESHEFSDVEIYSSYFNRLIIRGNSGLLLRVNADYDLVENVADSIWNSRGYEWHYDDYEAFPDEFNEYDELIDDLREYEEAIEVEDEFEFIDEVNHDEFDYDHPDHKTYYELRDSVEWELQTEYMFLVVDELLNQKVSLTSEDQKFSEQLTHEVDGIYYFDNSRLFIQNDEVWYFQAMYPQLYLGIKELYKDNIILGDFKINDNSIEMNMNAEFSDDLGSIYQAMNKSKFNKNVRDYIHKDNSAFFTYNIDLRAAYEQTLDVVIPLLENEPSSQITANLMVIELLDEFMNKKTIFDSYQGSIFGTFNGIKTVQTEKYIFEYDEETYEYIEELVEAEEQMPIFTLGYATKRLDIVEKALHRLERLSKRIHKENGYWVIENAILNSAPLYLIAKNNLFILTNDADLAMNHSDGYGSQAISKKRLKKAKKGGSIYAAADMGRAVEQLPRELFDETENEMIDVLRGKSGNIEMTSSGSTDNEFSMKLIYDFEGEYDNSGTYILDLINSVYVLMR